MEIEEPTFKEVQQYYNEVLHPDQINFNDQQVYKNIFHKGKWAGIFQFTEKGAQNFCRRAKPRNIINIAAITSIYQAGALSANVHELYVEAKENPGRIKYTNDIVKEVTHETYGFLIFQEQIALLAHKLGKDISLDEGNKLRKLLTKKDTAEGQLCQEKKLFIKSLLEGCIEKGLDEQASPKLVAKV